MSRLFRLTPQRTVVIGLTLFIVYFALAGWFRQVNLATAQFDMGNMDQTLWHTIHGRFFQMTDPGSPTLQSRAAWHADFLLLIYTPFYALWPDPRTMLILQVLIVSSGAIPLFWIARRRIGDWPAALVTLLYLGYPALQHGLIFDVHAVVLVTPILLWAWWAAVQHRWWVYYPMVGLALLGKEEVGVTVAAIGLYWIWRRGYRTMGIISILLGIGTTLVMLGIVIPALRGAPGHFAIGTYAQFGMTSSEVFRNVVTHPLTVITSSFSASSLALYARLLIPVAGVALLGWPILLLAVPELLVNVLSSNPNQHTILFQYMSVAIPFVFLALIEGYHVLQQRWPIQRRRIFFGLAAIGALSVWLWCPLPGMRHRLSAEVALMPSPYRDDVRTVQQLLLPTDKVEATNNILPQFSRRNLIWGFPNSLDQADAIIVLEGGDYEFEPKERISARVRALTENPYFTLALHHDSFWYFRRAAGVRN